MDVRNVLLVANPAAQSGQARGLIPSVLTALAAAGHEVRLLETDAEGNTQIRVTEAVMGDRGLQVVLAMGGDGTFAEVARGVLDVPGARPLMGLLPSGTAENHARSLGIPSVAADLPGCVSVIGGGQVLEMDVGRLTAWGPHGEVRAQRRFFDSVGWGIQAQLLETRARLHRRFPRALRGDRGFIAAVLRDLPGMATSSALFDAALEVDGQVLEVGRLTDVVVSASRFYGGAWILDEGAEPDDGRFELILFRGYRELALKGVRDLARWGTARGRLFGGLSVSENLHGAGFELRFEGGEERGICSQIDGEVGPRGHHFGVALDPRALRMLVPVGAARSAR
jgi:diacylglycerol kinase family enzyme